MSAKSKREGTEGLDAWELMRKQRRDEPVNPRARVVGVDRGVLGNYDTTLLEMPTLAKYERLCR